MSSTTPVICSAGEGAVLIRFGIGIDLAVSEAVLGCLTRLDASAERPAGVTDMLPAYAALLVHFDPLQVTRNCVEEWICQHLVSEQSGENSAEPRHVEIPVQYGGQHGLDIDEVARFTGLDSAAEVARIHSQADYRVYFLGFLGGFPYLGGLQAPLTSVPRLTTPREKLLAGTVGIAGGQTGVYTVESPGGWHLLGKTSMKLFDPNQDPPAVLRAGDLVNFVPVEKVEEETSNPSARLPAMTDCRQSFEILSPGPQTTVQDLGRFGYSRHGVGRAGAADSLSLRMGNSLVGNAESDAALEILMGGLKLRLTSADALPLVCVLTGADCSAKLIISARGQTQGRAATPLKVNQTFQLRPEDELHLGFATDGMRGYLCVAGGVAVGPVLGSRATDVRGRMGGFAGRPLQGGDVVPLGGTRPLQLACWLPHLLRSAVYDPLRRVGWGTGEDGSRHRVWELRVLPGPGDPSASAGSAPEEMELCRRGREFTVLGKSDRMAVCLAPAGSDAADVVAHGPLKGGQQLSEPCVSGTIQLPPDGNPVVLLAEHQTTGGYRVAGTVIQADLWRLGQMRQKDRVLLRQVDEAQAVAALREVRDKWARETCPLPYPLAATKVPREVPRASYELAARRGSELRRIDLNADAGEGFDDETLLKFVTSVNVACGGHAGDALSMARTVALAVAAGAGIGAHVSFEDREGFGRRKLSTPPSELFQQMLSQTGALMAVCEAAGRRVRYIKPHGALYHTVMEGGEQGRAVREAAQLLRLPLLLMPRSGWATFGEGFSERAYDSNGKEGADRDDWFTLRPRDRPGAVIHDPEEAAAQALRLARQATVHSICVHSDSPNAANVASAVRAALESQYEMRPFCTPESDFDAESDSRGGAQDAAAAGRTRPPPTDSDAESKATAEDDAGRAPPRLRRVLEVQVAPTLLRGYRRGEGCEADVYPQPRACAAVEELMERLQSAEAAATPYSSFACGVAAYADYISALRQQLRQQGGGWVTVAPRDTCQQGNDSESAAISDLSRRNAEVWAARAGCVGYEIGGAQYQAALMRGLDPAAVLTLGLPCNMPAHSLQRAQYVNGLAELAPAVRAALFEATAELVSQHYRRAEPPVDPTVPWHPYNFHAGNFVDESSGYSPLDTTTAELLDAQCWPMPCWVFSSHFTLQQLERWTRRQIELFASRGRRLQCVRVKNPGQGLHWTAGAVWDHCKVIIRVFAESGEGVEPIIYIHNHDMNGAASHIGAELLKLAQGEGFRYLVVDAAYRKNGTHNDNTIIASALTLDDAQLAALDEYNRNQQAIERLLTRFDSRTSQMTPWDSDWAGGTEGSDLRIAKEYGLEPAQIETAKRVASAVFPLERAVTPFSEYKLRLGIGVMIEPALEPKTAAAVRDWIVNKQGKLKVGGDVLLGLRRWETLVAKPPEVDAFLANMADEVAAAVSAQTDASKRVVPDDVPAASFSAAQRFTALGFQRTGLDFVLNIAGTRGDLSPLLLSPHVLHRAPLTLPPGTKLQLLTNALDRSERTTVEFCGFEVQGEDVKLSFRHGRREGGEGGDAVRLVFSVTDRESAAVLSGPAALVAGTAASASASSSGARKADPSKYPNEYPCEIPGELLHFAVKEGEVLQEGRALCTVVSMKMEMYIAVPAELDGRRVKRLGPTARSESKAGDFVSAGDLLLEVE